MTGHVTRWWLVTLAVAALGTPGTADIKVTPVVAAGHVLASFAAADAFTDDSRELVRSGMPLTFAYQVELRRPSIFWLDRTVGQASVTARVKFDSLPSTFQVTKEQDGHVIWSKSTGKEEEMRQWVTTFEAVPITPTEPLEANADYYVRVRLDARPHLKFLVWPFWPFGHIDAIGRADFTFIR